MLGESSLFILCIPQWKHYLRTLMNLPWWWPELSAHVGLWSTQSPAIGYFSAWTEKYLIACFVWCFLGLTVTLGRTTSSVSQYAILAAWVMCDDNLMYSQQLIKLRLLKVEFNSSRKESFTAWFIICMYSISDHVVQNQLWLSRPRPHSTVLFQLEETEQGNNREGRIDIDSELQCIAGSYVPMPDLNTVFAFRKTSTSDTKGTGTPPLVVMQ